MRLLPLFLLAGLAILPLVLVLARAMRLRGRREAALATHRAQLAELERDAALGRLLPEELGAARLEVQRRLLADAALPEEGAGESGRLVPALLMALVLAGGAGLYALHGRPDLPAEPLAGRQAAAASAAARDDALIGQLRARLAVMDPTAEHTREGWELLGRAELGRGHIQEASEAWQKALSIRFDPELAAETAETMVESAGGMTPDAQALFQKALRTLPPDSPIRDMIQRRLAGS